MTDKFEEGQKLNAMLQGIASKNAGAKKWIYQWHGSIERGSHIFIKPDNGFGIGDEIAYFPEGTMRHEWASLLVQIHNAAIDAAHREPFWWFKRLRVSWTFREFGFWFAKDSYGWGLSAGPFRLGLQYY